MTFADWINIFELISTVAAVVALVIAVVQLKAAARTTEAQFIIAMDESLHHFEDVRATLNNSDPASANVRLRRYIGRFERLGILLESGQTTLERINQFYGSRLERLLKDETVKQVVRQKPDGWRAFIYLWEKLYDGNLPGREFPPPHVRLERRERFESHVEEE